MSRHGGAGGASPTPSTSNNPTTPTAQPPNLLQVDPPGDWETYVHRSGRTGRAGHTGTCVTLATKRMEYMVPIIEVRLGWLGRLDGCWCGGWPDGAVLPGCPPPSRPPNRAARRNTSINPTNPQPPTTVQKKGGFKYERIGAPQPADMARIAAERAVEAIRDVNPTVVPYFKCVLVWPF
jgi:hypothetical protein